MNNNTEIIEQSILSIEDRAETKRQTKYIDGSINAHTKNDWQSCYKEGFIAGANEMLPIIKELGETLKELDFIYGNKDAYTKDTIGYKAAERIRTTLDKYKNYL